jgi:hypothetical protein
LILGNGQQRRRECCKKDFPLSLLFMLHAAAQAASNAATVVAASVPHGLLLKSTNEKLCVNHDEVTSHQRWTVLF